MYFSNKKTDAKLKHVFVEDMEHNIFAFEEKNVFLLIGVAVAWNKSTNFETNTYKARN